MKNNKGNRNGLRYFVNEDFFEKWSTKMAWVLGVIVSDGNVFKKQNRIKISMRDRDILEKIKLAMGSNHPIKKYRYFSSWDGKKKFIYELILARKKIVDSLMGLGVMPNKSKVVRFPLVPRRYLKHFIRGVFDGDGNVNITTEKGHKRIRPRIYSGSLFFANTLKKVLVSIGIPVSIQPHHGLFSLNISSKLWEWMYSDMENCFGERKYRLVEGEPIK